MNSKTNGRTCYCRDASTGAPSATCRYAWSNFCLTDRRMLPCVGVGQAPRTGYAGAYTVCFACGKTVKVRKSDALIISHGTYEGVL